MGEASNRLGNNLNETFETENRTKWLEKAIRYKEKSSTISVVFLVLFLVALPAGLFLHNVLTDEASECPKGYWCSSGIFKHPCPAGYYGEKAGLKTPNCSGICKGGYYCPPASSSAKQVICPAGTYCPPGSSKPLNCPGGYYGATSGLSLADCSGKCEKGYYCLEGSTSSQQHICPRGYYCTAGTRSPYEHICPQGWYGSKEGLGTSNCSGSCTPTVRKYCTEGSVSKEPVICPPGSYCDGSLGQGSRKLCPAGKYGESSGLSSSYCSGNCSAGYYCPPGSTSPTQEDCGSGFYCPEGTEKRLPCPVGKYGSSANLKTSDCDGSCAAGSFCPLNSSRSDAVPCPPGFYCPSGITDAYAFPCTAGYACSAGTSIPFVTCNLGHYCPEGTISPSQNPCPEGTYGGVMGLSNSNCSGKCFPGYYCLEGTINPKLLPCPEGSYCPEGTSDPLKFLCPATKFSKKIALDRIENCTCDGPSCDPDLQGMCYKGYYCPAGSTSSTQVICPPNHYCPAGSGEPILCRKTGFWCKLREYVEDAEPNEALATLLNNLPTKAELWAIDYPDSWNGLRWQGYNKVDAYVFATLWRPNYMGKTYAKEGFMSFSRGIDTVKYNVTLKGFFNVSVFLCHHNDANTTVFLQDVLKDVAKDKDPHAYLTDIAFSWKLPRNVHLGAASICIKDFESKEATLAFSDKFAIAHAGQVEPVYVRGVTFFSIYFIGLQLLFTALYLFPSDRSRNEEVTNLLRAAPSKFIQLLDITKICLEVPQMGLITFFHRSYQSPEEGIYQEFKMAVQILSPSLVDIFGFVTAFSVANILILMQLALKYYSKTRNISRFIKISPEESNISEFKNESPKGKNVKFIQKLLDWAIYETFYIPILLAIFSAVDCRYTSVIDGFDRLNEYHDEITLYGSQCIQCWNNSHYLIAIESVLLATIVIIGATRHATKTNDKTQNIFMIKYFKVLLICGKTTLCILSLVLVPNSRIFGPTCISVFIVCWGIYVVRWAHIKIPVLGRNKRANNWIVMFYCSIVWGTLCVFFMTIYNANKLKTSSDRTEIHFIVYAISTPILMVAIGLWNNKTSTKYVNTLQFKSLANHANLKIRENCVKATLSFIALSSNYEDIVQILSYIGELTQDFTNQSIRHAAITAVVELFRSNSFDVETVIHEELVNYEADSSKPFWIDTRLLCFTAKSDNGTHLCKVYPSEGFSLLQKPFESVVVADLSNQGLRDDEAATLAIIFREATLLKVVTLERNHIGIKGVKLLIESLGVNTSLTTLKIGENRFSSEELFLQHESISNSLLSRYYMNETLPRIDFGEILLIRFLPSEVDSESDSPETLEQDKSQFDTRQQAHLRLLELGTEDDELLPEYVGFIHFENKIPLPESCEKEIRSLLLHLAILRIPLKIFCHGETPDSAKLAIANALLLNTQDVNIENPNLRLFSLNQLRIRPFRVDQKTEKVVLKPHSMTSADFEMVKGLLTIDTKIKEVVISENIVSLSNASNLGKVLQSNTQIRDFWLSPTPLRIQHLRGKEPESRILDFIGLSVTDQEALILFKLLETNTKTEKLRIFSTAVYHGSANSITDTIADGLREMLRKNKSIKKLSFGSQAGGNMLSYPAISKLFTGLRHHLMMTSIDLRNNPIGSLSCQQISEFLKLPGVQLKSIKLNQGNISDEGCKFLSEALSVNESLQKLFIPSNNIGEKGSVALFHALCKNTTIHTLVLDNNDLSKSSEDLAVMISKNVGVKRLSISGCGLIGSSTLCDALSRNKGIEKLNIAENKHLQPELMLEFISVNTTLLCLNMQSCLIDDKGVKTLVNSLEQNQSLTILDISENKISDIGAQRLLTLLSQPKCSIRTISLRSNFQITNELREELSELQIMVEL